MRYFLTKVLSVVLAPSAATRRQRQTLGTVILVVAVLMAVLGSFCLKEGVSPGTSLLFWGTCFLLVLWTVFIAYVDVKSLKNELRIQKRDLFLSTFSRAEFEKKVREKSAHDPPLGKTEGPRAIGCSHDGKRE